jgi:hypothetical protein
MSTILNYELSPNPATIFGCMLPAPWLGAMAGLLLAFGPLDGFPHRFSALNLALVHCLALGMLAPIMIGALFQMFPVIAGENVSGSRFIAPFVAIGSATIAIGLSVGFISHLAIGFIIAMGVATVLYGAVFVALIVTVFKVNIVDATTRSLCLAPLALACVVGLGIVLAGTFAGWWSINLPYFLNMHVAWGSVAWLASLILGVASTVVPMFWQTKRPNKLWQRYVPWVLWPALLLLPFSLFFPVLTQASIQLSCVLIALFSSIALYEIWHAKRHFDPAWPLWLVCAASWLLAALLTSILSGLYDFIPDYWQVIMPWWIGCLVLVGGAVFPVNAMLGKIIPFLIFHHLRRQIPLGIRVPTMQAILPVQRLKWQARIACFTLLLLLSLPALPEKMRIVAGLSFALSQTLLGSFLLMSLFRYRHELRARLFSSKK